MNEKKFDGTVAKHGASQPNLAHAERVHLYLYLILCFSKQMLQGANTEHLKFITHYYLKLTIVSVKICFLHPLH